MTITPVRRGVAGQSAPWGRCHGDLGDELPEHPDSLLHQQQRPGVVLHQINSTTWSPAYELGGDVNAVQIDAAPYYDGTTQQPAVVMLNSSGDLYQDYSANNAWSGWTAVDDSSGNPVTDAIEIAIAPLPGTSDTNWEIFWEI